MERPSALHGRQAHVAGRRWGAGAARGAPPAQPASPSPFGDDAGDDAARVQRRWGELVPVDLPIDLVVVLEQEERAGRVQCAAHVLRKSGRSLGGEHVFAR